MERVINILPGDVIIRILLKLPVVSLLRFRCVCTIWFNLIKSSDFITMHLNYPVAENEHQIIIKRYLEDIDEHLLSVYSNIESLSITSPDLQIPHMDCRSIKVLGPCNGLVCISNSSIIDTIVCYEIILLCNPAMREFMLLPERPFGCPEDFHCFYEGVGFGFDVNTNDYKVVRIVNIEDEESMYYSRYMKNLKVEVYQCSTNTWRETDATLPDLYFLYCCGIFFHGATYWDAHCMDGKKIFAFNITTEVFQEFDIPDGCIFKSKSLAVLNESLAMLYYTNTSREFDQRYIDVWVMREYGISDSWTKQFTVGPLSENLHPITIWKNSAILMERTNGQLISCAIGTQEIMEFDIFGYPESLQAFVYKESLVSIRK